MANHVRSPVSVTIPEAVTVDGVTIYKIHVSSILKSGYILYVRGTWNIEESHSMTNPKLRAISRFALERSPTRWRRGSHSSRRCTRSLSRRGLTGASSTSSPIFLIHPLLHNSNLIQSSSSL